MASETITRRTAAKMIGVHQDTLSRLLNGVLAAAVLDRKGRGGALVLSRPAIEVYVAVQLEAQPFNHQHEISRRNAAAADLAEFRLHVEKGKYLEVEEVRTTWAGNFTAMRNRLLAFASLLAGRLGVDAAVIEEEVHQVLTELSDPAEDAGKPTTPTTKKATRRKVQKKTRRKKAAKRKRKKAA